MKTKIFISYSHADGLAKKMLVEHLSSLEQEGLVDVWHDGRIRPGLTYQRDIEAAIQEARIALLLISPDFLKSTPCMELELPQILMGWKASTTHVLPILIRDSEWRKYPQLEQFQALPRKARPFSSLTKSEQKEELGAITDAIRSMIRLTPGRQKPNTTNYSEGYGQKLFSTTGSEIFCLAFSPDGKWLAAGCNESVWLWDVSEGQYHIFREPLERPLDHPKYVYAVAFSPDSSLLATAGQDKAIRVYSTDSWHLKWDSAENPSTHKDAIYSITWSPDGEFLLSGSYDQTVKFWKAESGETGRGFKVDGRVSCISHAPPGCEPWIAVACHDNSIYLINRRSGEQRTLGGKNRHLSSVESVAFTPDGRYLVSGGLDKAVILWDVNRNVSKWRRGDKQHHKYLVKSVAASPDGLTLASASWDKEILLWDLEGVPFKTIPLENVLPWHEDWIWTVAFSADGKVLASGDSNGSVMVWCPNEPEKDDFPA